VIIINCLICNRKIKVKKNFNNLFDNNKYFICDKCYFKYQVSLNYQMFEYNNKKIHWFYMFEEEYYINFNGFIKEFSYLFNYVKKKLSKNSILLVYEYYKDYLYDSKYINNFNDIDEIFLITYC
jgi:hypothetical protein